MSSTTISNTDPFTLIAGMNVLEDQSTNFEVASTLKGLCEELDLKLIFKASFDKANRSALSSARGPGLDLGLSQLKELRQQLEIPVLTDIHQPSQASIVADVVDVIQIPAFLCRQTDLISAAAKTGRPLHIKKMQMMAPREMGNVLQKCRDFGADNIWLCERGTLFGYHNLVVDPLSFGQLKALGAPITFDVTHSLQQPGALGDSTGGRGQYVRALARVGISQGIAALFIETHPDPARAHCDGPCAIPLQDLPALLKELKELDLLVKSWP